MARYQVTLLRKLVIEQKTSCEMLYHNLLDCDPQTNSLRYKRVTCRKNYSDRDNGALSSNTLDFYTRVAPLGLGFFGIPVFYTHAGSLSQSLSVPLIPAGAKNLYP